MDQGAFGQLVRSLSRLPGLGPRSARRIALHLLTTRTDQLPVLVDSLQHAAAVLKVCAQCGNLDDNSPCYICTDAARDQSALCVVASVADVWAVERTHQFKGLYHVLGGVLSAIDGVTPDMLTVGPLIDRLRDPHVREVVFGLSATVDGQSTVHYLMDRIFQAYPGTPLRMTRLALGLPMGGELDYLDDGTIAAALKARAVL